MELTRQVSEKPHFPSFVPDVVNNWTVTRLAHQITSAIIVLVYTLVLSHHLLTDTNLNPTVFFGGGEADTT